MQDNISKTTIDNIGQSLKKQELSTAQQQTIQSWRAYHSIISDKFFDIFRTEFKEIVNYPISARLKRLPSIKKKLLKSSMRLTQMQDILGFRIVVNKIAEIYKVEKLLKNFFQNNNKYSITYFDTDDYIKNPKPDGYRCIHLILKAENKYYIEIQIRTKIQHLWATTLETVSAVLNKDFKHDYKKGGFNTFFKKVSDIICNFEQGSTQNFFSIIKMMRIYYSKYLRQIQVISLYSQSIRETLKKLEQTKQMEYTPNLLFILNLEEASKIINKKPYDESVTDTSKILRIKVFKNNEEALKNYNQRELNKHNERHDIVLITSTDLKFLETNYPNYYLNCDEFLQQIQIMIKNATIQYKFFGIPFFKYFIKNK